MKSGPKKGFKQSPEHIAKRKRFGTDHSQWLGDGASVQAGRQRARRLYPDRLCSKPGCVKKAERHHKDGDTLNNDPSNIDYLCRKHHMEEDGRLEKVREQAIKNQPKAVAARW